MLTLLAHTLGTIVQSLRVITAACTDQCRGKKNQNKKPTKHHHHKKLCSKYSFIETGTVNNKQYFIMSYYKMFNVLRR